MKVITLCGSTKFKEQFEKVNADFTLQGNVVISIGFFEQSEGIEITEEQEALFAKIHLKKIEMADEVFIIDVNGYIGDSTRKEIEYAKSLGKTIRYFSETDLSKKEEELLLNSAKGYVKQALKHETTGHDWRHIYRVTEMSKHIAEQEGANGFICQLAALFHDLADEKVVASKEEGLAVIKSWLEQNNVGKSIVDAVLEIISTMSYRGGNGAPMKTLEGMVVQDADRLDAIGALGIARTFVYAGSKGHAIYDPEIVPRERMTEEQYRHEKSTAVNHFYEKLLKLQGLMNTRAAKRLAEQRHAFMERYLEQFYLEWNLESIETRGVDMQYGTSENKPDRKL